MFYPDRIKEATEDGTISFLGNNYYMVQWKYKDHVIRCVFKQHDGGFTMAQDPTPGIKILYPEGDRNHDVSDKYLEYLNNVADVHVRTTLDNLAIVAGVIDKNIEDYIGRQK